jgi:hypothetical protein
MKVPVYEGPRVDPQPVALPVETARPANYAPLEAGLENLSRGLQQYKQNVQREEQKAIAATTTDAETTFTKRVTGEIHGDSTSGKTGFMSLQGRSAEADGAPVMERIEKHRQDVANGLSNAEAKQLFLQRTGKQVESLRASVETHVSSERHKADAASLNARADAAVEAMFNAARVGDGATVKLQSMALEGPIRALALSPEDAESDVQKWRRRTVATQLDAFLEVKRLDVAEALLKYSKDLLGAQAAKKYQTEIDARKLVVTAEGAADSIIAKAQQSVQSRPFSAPDRATAEQLLAKLPADVQKAAAPLVKERLVLLDQQADEDRKKFITDAHAAYNRNRAGFFATPMAKRLNEVDPRLYDQLSERAERRLEHLQRKRSNGAEERRRQAELNKVAIQEFLALPTDEQANTNIDTFLAGYETGGVSSDVDPVPSALKDVQKKAREQVQRGVGVSADTFVADVKSALRDFAPAPGNSKESRGRAAAWWADKSADARNAYNLWLDNNPNKKPTREDLDAIKAEVIGGLPPNPANPESISAAGRALSTRGGGATGRAPAPAFTPIPADERKQIEDALRKKGRVITEQAIQSLYNQVHRAR